MVCFVSCFHGRADVSAVFLQHCAEIGITGRMFAAVTIGDSANIDLLARYGVWYIERENLPLGAKHNAALRLAIEEGGDWSHVMVLPSDDLVSAGWVDACREHQYGTPLSCAVLCPATGRAKLLVTRPGGRMRFGACRVFGRDVVDRLGGKLWADHHQRGLDGASDARVRAAGFALEGAGVRGPAFVDIKGPESLWGFDVWTGDAITVDEALWMCSDSVKAALLAPR